MDLIEVIPVCARATLISLLSMHHNCSSPGFLLGYGILQYASEKDEIRPTKERLKRILPRAKVAVE